MKLYQLQITRTAKQDLKKMQLYWHLITGAGNGAKTVSVNSRRRVAVGSYARTLSTV